MSLKKPHIVNTNVRYCCITTFVEEIKLCFLCCLENKELQDFIPQLNVYFNILYIQIPIVIHSPNLSVICQFKMEM